MTTSPTPGLTERRAHELITTFFDRAVDADPEPWFALFADDVVVEDEGRERHGLAAVRAWRSEVPSVTYAVRGVTGAGRAWVATATVAGDFPGSPVDLRYAFGFDEHGLVRDLRIRG